jgi:hypothetical protein
MWWSLVTLALGAVGWLTAKFLFEPVKEIYELRRDVQECLLVHGDLSKDAPQEERVAAADAFARLGAGLVARDLAAYRWVRWFCLTLLRLDIYSAGALLIGIGNDTRRTGFSFAGASPTIPIIRTCLRLSEPRIPSHDRSHAGSPFTT